MLLIKRQLKKKKDRNSLRNLVGLHNIYVGEEMERGWGGYFKVLTFNHKKIVINEKTKKK